MTARRKRQTSVYLDPGQLDQLQRLSERAEIPVAALVRSGVDMVLRKHDPIERHPEEERAS